MLPQCTCQWFFHLLLLSEQNLSKWRRITWHIGTNTDLDIQLHVCNMSATCLQLHPSTSSLLSSTPTQISYVDNNSIPFFLCYYNHCWYYFLSLTYIIWFYLKRGERNHWISFLLSVMQLIHLILYKFILPFINTYQFILYVNFTSSIVIIFPWEVIVFLLSPLDFAHPLALVFECFS